MEGKLVNAAIFKCKKKPVVCAKTERESRSRPTCESQRVARKGSTLKPRARACGRLLFLFLSGNFGLESLVILPRGALSHALFPFSNLCTSFSSTKNKATQPQEGEEARSHFVCLFAHLRPAQPHHAHAQVSSSSSSSFSSYSD